jgi:tetratricopeptide (TPR) repeat protein
VVFVSGVFKDKVFAAETIRKTGAVDFLFKPYTTDELTETLGRILAPLLSSEKWTVQSLLTRKLLSERERAKAIEHLEQIKGLDFCFVLSILMDVKSSGNLTIVTDGGEIYGVALHKGEITAVDSSEAYATGVMNLISSGYLSQEDWDAFQASASSKFTLEKLVTEGLVSPHAIEQARHDQIFHDLRDISEAQNLQISFSQEEGSEPIAHTIQLPKFIQELLALHDEFLPVEYLELFYEQVANAPMRLTREASEVDWIWEIESLKNAEPLKAVIEQTGTLTAALQKAPDAKGPIYRCLHCLVMSRALIFDDVNRAKTLNDTLERYRKLHQELQNRTPDKILEYFGANVNSTTSVQNVFEEYSRSNNPSQLSKEATPELRDLCQKCYDLMVGAHEILTNDDKRAELTMKLREQAAQNQTRAQHLTTEGYEALKQGRASEALNKFVEAESLSPSHRLTTMSIWAEAKTGALAANKGRIKDLQMKLERMAGEDRKTAHYFMASAMLKKIQGDLGAIPLFERALQANPDFAEARREMNSLYKTSEGSEKKKLDILTGDITEVVSHLFRRKAD